MQLFQDPSGTGQIFRSLVILHQLFNDRRINPRLLAFLALLFSLLLLGHFHLLSQVVTHTQILRHPPPPSEPDRRLSRIRLSSWWLVSTGDWPTHPLYGIRFVQWLSPVTGAANRH